MEFQHTHLPVLFEETLAGLALRPGDTVVDGTFGGGGHAGAILSRIGPDGLLVAIDRDLQAVDRARARFGTRPNFHIVHADFEQIDTVLAELDIPAVDAAMLDLGVSSYQLEEAQRGFSYMQEGPLDMRMDRTMERSAADIIRTYDEKHLADVIRTYGEEKWAARIAAFIVAERARTPITTTSQLVDIIRAAVPQGARRQGPHPAKRTFQALRIEVNSELSGLAGALDRFVNALRPYGRLCVITFHSLEDRIVKQEFRRLADPCTCPPDFPVCVCGGKPQIRVVTRRPVCAGEKELAENPRARSAKLRIAEKLPRDD